MKKFNLLISYIFICLFVLSGLTYSQSYPTDKGSKVITGSFAFSVSGGDLYENSEGDKLFTLDLNTTAGFFISPGFSIGGKVQYNNTSQSGYSYTQIGIGPQIAHYFGSGERRSYPFINASVLFISRTSAVTGYQIYFGGGVCVMAAKSIGISGELGYQVESLSHDSYSATGSRISLSIGIKAFFF
ncbi:MAG: hypothetical protein V1773_10760 [bacterium]